MVLCYFVGKYKVKKEKKKESNHASSFPWQAQRPPHLSFQKGDTFFASKNSFFPQKNILLRQNLVILKKKIIFHSIHVLNFIEICIEFIEIFIFNS